MNIKSRAGFTLIELMVVAIIVAILAAVAIPLMSGNRRKAMATEAQTGCGAIKTAIRVMEAEQEPFPAAWANLKGLAATDLDGTYFMGASDYSWAGTYSNYVITVTGTSGKHGLTATDTVIMTNVFNSASWGGSMLE